MLTKTFNFVMDNSMAPEENINWALLGFIRFILAFIVVASHLSEHLITMHNNAYTPSGAVALLGGKAAVIGFFLISGFSIAASINSRPKGFIFRRIIRIYPLYFGALLLTLAVQFYFSQQLELADNYTKGDSWLVIIGNLFLTQMFLCKALAFNGPFWSLSIEFSYYLLAPFFLMLKPRYTLLLILLSCLVLLLPKTSDFGYLYFVVGKFNALKYIWAWLLGFHLFSIRSDCSKYAGLVFAVLVFSISAIYSHWLNLITIGLTYLAILHSSKIRLSPTIISAFNYLGDISYPVYLVHFPIIKILIVGFAFSNELAVYACVFCWAAMTLWLFDDLLKNLFFKPLFVKIFQTSSFYYMSSLLPEKCQINYRLEQSRE